jgi:hypothetical protein
MKKVSGRQSLVGSGPHDQSLEAQRPETVEASRRELGGL